MVSAARARGLAPGRGQSRWTEEFSASTSGENSRSSYRIYQQTAIDTYSKVGFAKLYDRKTALTAAELLNDVAAA